MPAFTFELVIVLLPIVLNGAFAMSEMAIVSARKPRLEHRAESGDRRARIALNLANDPNQLLSTIQVGITLIGIINGAYGGTSLAAPVAMADGGRRHLRLCPACHQTCYLPLVAEVSGRGVPGSPGPGTRRARVARHPDHPPRTYGSMIPRTAAIGEGEGARSATIASVTARRSSRRPGQ